MNLRSRLRQKIGRRHRQRGATAIEFASLFGLFFLMLYAIMTYSIPLLLMLTFKQISADAARAAVRVDPAQEAAVYSQVISREISLVIDQSWLPTSWMGGNCPPPNSERPWQALPASSGASYGHLATEDLGANRVRHLLHVCLQRTYNRTGPAHERAIIPTLDLFGFSLPSLPSEEGEVIIRGQTITRL